MVSVIFVIIGQIKWDYIDIEVITCIHDCCQYACPPFSSHPSTYMRENKYTLKSHIQSKCFITLRLLRIKFYGQL